MSRKLDALVALVILYIVAILRLLIFFAWAVVTIAVGAVVVPVQMAAEHPRISVPILVALGGLAAFVFWM
jgi:hypothetical protein